MIFQCYPIISMQKNTRIQDRSLVDIVEFTCGITQSMQLFSIFTHIYLTARGKKDFASGYQQLTRKECGFYS